MEWFTKKRICLMALVEPSEQIKLDLSMASSKMEKDMGLIDGLAKRAIFNKNNGVMVSW
jgi:hypothetical protein